MQGAQLNPEKITHPFQLMAAWFAMLILLVGIFLAAAARIETPKWAPGFLIISSVGISIIVMAAVFAMLTRFRPHLQGPKEYADWIKDERKFKGQILQGLEIHELRQRSDMHSELLRASTTVLTTSTIDNTAKYRVDVSNIEGAGKLVKALSELGFEASVYRDSLGQSPGERRSKAQHEAIWIGSKVPSRIAIRAIKTATGQWPHLQYLHLSGDGGEEPPDEIHQQIFIGGSTNTAEQYGLESWTADEIEKIPDRLANDKFHDLIRTKYGWPREQ